MLSKTRTCLRSSAQQEEKCSNNDNHCIGMVRLRYQLPILVLATMGVRRRVTIFLHSLEIYSMRRHRNLDKKQYTERRPCCQARLRRKATRRAHQWNLSVQCPVLVLSSLPVGSHGGHAKLYTQHSGIRREKLLPPRSQGASLAG